MAIKSKISSSAQIASTAVIADDVIIGDNTIIADYAVIRDGVRIGSNCQIFPFAVLGEDPQDNKYQGEKTFLEIGDNNILREYVTIHRAAGEGQKTVIGNNNFLMVSAHVGHNAKLGSNIVMANNSCVGGHALIEDYVNMGGGAMVHQNCRVGEHAMMGGLSASNKDLLPYMIYFGVPSAGVSTNRIGLKRAGVDQAARSEIMRAFRIVFGSKLTLPSIKEKLSDLDSSIPQIKHFIDFIENSTRGIETKLHREY